MFDNYVDKIKGLKSFEKEDILNKTFELYSNDKMKIYYAPHNEIVNNNAKVFIVGITPGWTQTSIAYKTANAGLLKGLDYEEIKKRCKQSSRFAGSMRKNLIEMLDNLELHKKLGIKTCLDLFEDKDTLLHTTSLIPYPVFINNKNYTGSMPKIMENEILYSYVKKYFYNEVSKLSKVLIIPLGKAVEEVLEEMVKQGIISESRCLFGFPHPSGANGHRKKQFMENREHLLKKVQDFFEEKE